MYSVASSSGLLFGIAALDNIRPSNAVEVLANGLVCAYALVLVRAVGFVPWTPVLGAGKVSIG